MVKFEDLGHTELLAKDQIDRLYWKFKGALGALKSSGASDEELLKVIVSLTQFRKSEYRELRKMYLRTNYDFALWRRLMGEVFDMFLWYPLESDMYAAAGFLLGGLCRMFKKKLTPDEKFQEDGEELITRHINSHMDRKKAST